MALLHSDNDLDTVFETNGDQDCDSDTEKRTPEDEVLAEAMRTMSIISTPSKEDDTDMVSDVDMDQAIREVLGQNTVSSLNIERQDANIDHQQAEQYNEVAIPTPNTDAVVQ